MKKNINQNNSETNPLTLTILPIEDIYNICQYLDFFSLCRLLITTKIFHAYFEKNNSFKNLLYQALWSDHPNSKRTKARYANAAGLFALKKQLANNSKSNKIYDFFSPNPLASTYDTLYLAAVNGFDVLFLGLCDQLKKKDELKQTIENYKTIELATVMHAAAQSNNPIILEYLLKLTPQLKDKICKSTAPGAGPVSGPITQGPPPILTAIEFDSVNTFKLLLDAPDGSKPTAERVNHCLLAATEANALACLTYLVDQFKDEYVLSLEDAYTIAVKKSSDSSISTYLKPQLSEEALERVESKMNTRRNCSLM